MFIAWHGLTTACYLIKRGRTDLQGEALKRVLAQAELLCAERV